MFQSSLNLYQFFSYTTLLPLALPSLQNNITLINAYHNEVNFYSKILQHSRGREPGGITRGGRTRDGRHRRSV